MPRPPLSTGDHGELGRNAVRHVTSRPATLRRARGDLSRVSVCARRPRRHQPGPAPHEWSLHRGQASISLRSATLPLGHQMSLPPLAAPSAPRRWPGRCQRAGVPGLCSTELAWGRASDEAGEGTGQWAPDAGFRVGNVGARWRMPSALPPRSSQLQARQVPWVLLQQRGQGQWTRAQPRVCGRTLFWNTCGLRPLWSVWATSVTYTFLAFSHLVTYILYFVTSGPYIAVQINHRAKSSSPALFQGSPPWASSLPLNVQSMRFV